MANGDGAHLGVGAARALKTIVGGEDQPTKDERRTAEQLYQDIIKSPIEATSYEGTANACARLILEAWEKYPMLLDRVPAETPYLKDEHGKLVDAADEGLVAIGVGLHDVLLRLHGKDSPAAAVLHDLTGFMWAWAVNAARFCLLAQRTLSV